MYVVQQWSYDSDEEMIEKVIDHFRKIKKFTIIIDEEKDDSFILVGDGNDDARDIEQATMLATVINSGLFPK